MSLDAQLLRGASAALTSAGIKAACGRHDEALEDAETALRVLRHAIDTDKGHRELVARLVNDTEPLYSSDRDVRPSDDGEARDL
jgi:hypothetical protein